MRFDESGPEVLRQCADCGCGTVLPARALVDWEG